MKQKPKKNTVANKIKGPVKKPITKITVESKTLLSFVNAILTVGDQARLEIIDKTLHVNKVDNANVLLLVADCECTPEIPENGLKRFGIDILVLKKALRYSKDCRITLCIDGKNLSVSYGRFSARIPLVDEILMRKDPGEIKVELETEFEMPGKYLYDASTIISKNGKCYIYAKNGVAFVAAEEGDLCIREVVGTCDKSSQARSLFSNDYIRDVANIVKTTEIKVRISIDHPVQIMAEQHGCKFNFLMAPRIEAD